VPPALTHTQVSPPRPRVLTLCGALLVVPCVTFGRGCRLWSAVCCKRHADPLASASSDYMKQPPAAAARSPPPAPQHQVNRGSQKQTEPRSALLRIKALQMRERERDCNHETKTVVRLIRSASAKHTAWRLLQLAAAFRTCCCWHGCESPPPLPLLRSGRKFSMLLLPLGV